jgi:hypothetical protein
MALSADSNWLDQFGEGNPACGHASEMEAVLPTAGAASMTSAASRPRGVSTRSRAAMSSGTPTGGRSPTSIRGRARPRCQAKVLTTDEARRIAVNIANLPELLGKAERDLSASSHASQAAPRVLKFRFDDFSSRPPPSTGWGAYGACLYFTPIQ